MTTHSEAGLMDCVDRTPADKTYTRRAIVWSLVYIALVLALSSARRFHWLDEPWNWVTAWTPAIPIAGIMWALLVFLRDSDEFVRALTAKRIVIAVAISQVLCTIWGFLEVYAGASHQEMYLVFPIFWLSFVAVTPFVRSST